MFEVTPEDIALLNDTDLRTLVGRLCESEARSRGLSPSSVTWGGDQNATDDGIDVHVELPSGTVIDGFIPRAETGYQVKKMDMPPTAIRAEMRPTGTEVRPVIKELADRGGAYIIVTSSSTTYRMLKARLRAMTEAVNDVDNHAALALDLYDRTRLASWVRSHPGMVLWTRQRIGRVIQGWRPYGPWAYPPEGVDAEYLLDDQLRVQTGKSEDDDGLDSLRGMQHLRDILKDSGKAVRLVGLSGVGKTRFVQALFDSRVGEHSLDPSLAVYTNMSDGPNPQPLGLATDLIAAGTRAILIVDNCTPELHRQLSELCRTANSKLSLLTVEYDVRDHEPEGTEVFRLEPSSDALIEKLIEYRFPELSQVNVRTIARMSDGNARVAIAIAGTVEKSETISGLPDEELFRRLFQQTHGHDDSLLRAAQACSLVYSFQGEDVSDGRDAELVRLGGMVGKDAAEMFRHVAELERRDLVQRRGMWRALLPHALANRLARLALQNLAPSIIQGHLVNGASARLLRSFSRRLGYLSDSSEAVAIVTRWLAPDGLLAGVANFNDLGRAIFENVAPVAPEAVLSALERTLLGPCGDEALTRCGHFAKLLRLIGYEAPLFERCAALISKLALAADTDDKSNEPRNIFISLFFIYLSGTHATIEQRLRALKPLLLSDKPKEISLGVAALKSVLEAWHFGSSYSFEFGSRARNYGYRPTKREDVEHWFGTALNLAKEIACSNAESAPAVRAAIGEQLRGLWTTTGMHDEIEQVCRAISEKSFWQEGWIAVRETQHYDQDDSKPEICNKLSALERLLRPRDLVQKARTVVMSDGHHTYDVFDFDGDVTADLNEGMKRMNATVLELGKAVAVDEEAFEAVIGELLTGNSAHLWRFGRGLAEGCRDAAAMWERLRLKVAAAPSGKCNVQVLCGFLGWLHENDPALTDTFLDQVVEDETLAPFCPSLESATTIGSRGVKRLCRSLELGKAPIWSYQCLKFRGATDDISPTELKTLLTEIASNPSGLDVAVEVLYMRLQFEKTRPPAPEIIDTGLELLEMVSFGARGQLEDYRLGEIAKACLVGVAGATRATRICQNLKEAVSRHDTYVSYYDDMLLAIFSVQPRAALDALCGGTENEVEHGLSLIDDVHRIKNNLFNVIPEPVLLAWCDEKPSIRYPAVAGRITISTNKEGSEGKPEWSPIALRLLEKAPDRIEVVKRFIAQVWISGGWGSRAVIVEANARLLDELEHFPDPAVVAFVVQEKARLVQDIEKEKRSETARDRRRNERFE